MALEFRDEGSFSVGGCGSADHDDEVIELGGPCYYDGAGPNTIRMLREAGIPTREEFDRARLKGPKFFKEASEAATEETVIDDAHEEVRDTVYHCLRID